MEKINKNIARYEFTAVYTHKQAKADVVLVHGLNGHPQKTWTAPNGVFWPADLLPASLKNEYANVLVYGYNADVYSTRKDRSPSDNFVHQHAQSLVTSLTQYRKSQGTERNPIVWVAHSLGGIVTKRALLYSNDVRAHHQEDFRSIFVSTYGIVFLGTPHTGSDMATWGRVLQQMSDVVVPRRFFETESVLIKTLKKDNETLQSINSHFLDIYQRFRIHMVHENHTTDLKGTKVFVVDSSSASPQLPGVMYYGIEATHSGMCKFESENAPGYLNVSTAIREWVADSPEVIEVRWEVEEDDRRLRASLENFERTRPYERALAANNTPRHELVENNNEILFHHSPTEITAPPPHTALLLPRTPVEANLDPVEGISRQGALELQIETEEPLFIHPESFRPNSFFIGREDELRGLHEMLVDRKRRSEGTSAVLIQCLPGGGKTHLARQYVFQHKDDYPGGVYWVRAKSRHEMEYWYWRIAKNEALKGLVEQEDVAALHDPRRIVEIVRRWLNTRSGWLMVLDGIQFDTPGLHEFIPDAKHTSLIYTSTERAVTGDPRFDNPQVMELGLLTARQAQDLLLLEMDKKKPWSADDQAKALELVQLMGRLPLMIHVAAQHLKATREPLARYLKSYKTRPKAGGLPAYKAVRDKLEHRGANAALNLISILVFFDQHIPVEMLTLGLAALDNITPVKTCSASHRRTNLSNTLRVLIAFALVERTESDDISPTSSRSSKKSFDNNNNNNNNNLKHVEYLDLLRVHSVVQAFFIDSLNQQKQVPFWLERATAVWCRSYDDAHQRIQEDPTVGLPDDYRRFLIHGQKLLQNLERFEKKDPELLGGARGEVEGRLVTIQRQVDERSLHVMQSSIINEGFEVVVKPVSVFNRSSTMSETDSATASNQDSQHSWGQFMMGGGGGGSGHDHDHEPMQSPSAYDAVLNIQPHWPIPYPNRVVLMPPAPSVDVDDEGTAVPAAAPTPIMAPADVIMPGANVAESQVSGMDDLARSSSALVGDYEDWQEVIPHHRVIKRNELRRYHDRAGSWRDRSVLGDPRVGLSLEVASGSLRSRRGNSRSPSRHSRVTAQSDAEMELNKIKQSPATELGTSPAGSGSLSGLAKLIASPASWKAVMKRMTNNLPSTPPGPGPGRQPTEHQSPILSPSNLVGHQSQVSPEDDILAPPGPIFRGTPRTANSSPGSNASPFPPPTFSAAEAMLADEYLQQGLPVVVRRWETEEPPPMPSYFGDSPEQTWSGADPLSFSFPAPAPAPAPARGRYPYASPTALRGRGAQTGYQPPLTGSHMWTPGAPSGYTSQPMSRDPSHQSMSSGGGGGQEQQRRRPHNDQQHMASPASSGSRHRISISPMGAAALHPSSPLPISNSPDPDSLSPIIGSGLGSSRLVPIPNRRRHRRRPSYTETEPSPRLDPAFPDVDTSYQRWEQLHNPSASKPRGLGSGPSRPPLDNHLGRSFPPLQVVSDPPPGMSSSPRWQHINPGPGPGSSSSSSSRRGRGHHAASRSQSLSPSPSRSTSRLQHQHQHPLAYSASASTSPQLLPPQHSPDLRSVGISPSEPMARSPSSGTGTASGGGSPSAGIRLADGRIMEFTHLPPQHQQHQQAGTTTTTAPSKGKISPPLAAAAASVALGRRGSVPSSPSPLALGAGVSRPATAIGSTTTRKRPSLAVSASVAVSGGGSGRGISGGGGSSPSSSGSSPGGGVGGGLGLGLGISQ